LVFDVFWETCRYKKCFKQRVQRRNDAQMHGDVDQALLPPPVTQQIVHPNEAAVRQHALFEAQQATVLAKDGAVAQAQVVKNQSVVQAGEVNAQYCQGEYGGKHIGGFG
jgi:hypothetical protein